MFASQSELRERVLVLHRLFREIVNGSEFLTVMTLVVAPTDVCRSIVHNMSKVVGRTLTLPNH